MDSVLISAGNSDVYAPTSYALIFISLLDNNIKGLNVPAMYNALTHLHADVIQFHGFYNSSFLLISISLAWIFVYHTFKGKLSLAFEISFDQPALYAIGMLRWFYKKK